MKTEGKDCENVDRIRLEKYKSPAVDMVMHHLPPYQAG
jgi:hypothetical protein